MYTNNTNIPLPFAVWLAADHGYDLRFDPKTASATEILRPMRSIILSRELAQAEAEKLEADFSVTGDLTVTRDIADKAAAALGTAVHTAVEIAWREHFRLALFNLDYPIDIINNIRINPATTYTKKAAPEHINMYFERRSSKQIEGFTLSGKFDLVMEDGVRDIKTTKAYTYIAGSNDKKYIQQGSIYRWLNQDIITSDIMHVDYYFTDWSPIGLQKDPKNYPPQRMLSKPFNLMTLDNTEEFIRSKLRTIKSLTGKPQSELPRCTPEELWQNPAKWEYWSKATNKQCSKLHDTEAEAIQMIMDKGVGFTTKREFQPTFCLYCDASSICKQAQGYVAEGLLTL
jgi:hypothetical protein